MAKIKEAPEKPGNDVYTGLLALSLVAMIIGCVLLYLDFSNYEGRTPPKVQPFQMPSAGAPRGAAEPREGARLPAPAVPDLTLPTLPTAVAAKVPEPAMLPTLPDLPKLDPQVKTAGFEELPPLPLIAPAAPAAAKPAADGPPVLIPPFNPN